MTTTFKTPQLGKDVFVAQGAILRGDITNRQRDKCAG